MNLSHAIIKKSLKRLDSDCFSVGVLYFSLFKINNFLLTLGLQFCQYCDKK